jgi:hypothetical protein
LRWLWNLSGSPALPDAWVVVGVLAALIVTSVVALVFLWPRSRRWAGQNRLHRRAARTEASLRRTARDQLDEGLDALGNARRDYLTNGYSEDAQRLGLLIREIATLRDQTAFDYAPNIVDVPHRRPERELGQLTAGDVEQQCLGIAREAHDGLPLSTGYLGGLQRAIDGMNDRRLVLP